MKSADIAPADVREMGDDGFVVRRDAGRSSPPRVIYEGAEDVARRVYQAMAERLRQGAVELARSDGTVLARSVGPRLRIRW